MVTVYKEASQQKCHSSQSLKGEQVNEEENKCPGRGNSKYKDSDSRKTRPSSWFWRWGDYASEAVVPFPQNKPKCQVGFSHTKSREKRAQTQENQP